MSTVRKTDPERGQRIKYVRTEILGFRSQEQFAHWLGGVSRGAVGNWELGKEVGLDNLKAIAEKAGISLDWLAFDAGEKPKPNAKREYEYDDNDPASPDPINPDATHTWIEGEGPRGIPSDASAQIDVTGGMGGGGVTIVAEGVPGKSGMTFSADVIRDYWRLPGMLVAALGLRAKDIAIIEVQGNSMTPTLDEGDFVFIDTRHRWPSPDGLYALADEFGGIIVKRLELASRPGSQDKVVRVISDNTIHQPKEWALDEIQIIGRVMRRFTIPR